MIPSVFAARAGSANAHTTGSDVTTQRKAAAALGLISAIGAYGGFAIPQILNLSQSTTGNYEAAFFGFVAAYAVLVAVTYLVYYRRNASLAGQRL